MHAWPALLLTALLCGQVAKSVAKPAEDLLAKRLKPRAILLTPQAMLRAMVALDQAQRKQPGAVVEVIGYDDEAVLNLLALTVAERVRQEFHAMDSRGNQELYSFMHQDPSRPGLLQAAPLRAGGKAAHAEDTWLR